MSVCDVYRQHYEINGGDRTLVTEYFFFIFAVAQITSSSVFVKLDKA